MLTDHPVMFQVFLHGISQGLNNVKQGLQERQEELRRYLGVKIRGHQQL